MENQKVNMIKAGLRRSILQVSILMVVATSIIENRPALSLLDVEQVSNSFLEKGERPKSDKVKLKILASMPSAKVISNPADTFPRDVAAAIDEAQDVMNQLYRPTSSYGDKSSAFMVLLEQYKGGLGKEPVPVVGNSLHAEKCIGTIKNFRKRINSPTLLPPEAISRLEAEIQKMQKSLDWAKDYRESRVRAIPKWAKS